MLPFRSIRANLRLAFFIPSLISLSIFAYILYSVQVDKVLEVSDRKNNSLAVTLSNALSATAGLMQGTLTGTFDLSQQNELVDAVLQDQYVIGVCVISKSGGVILGKTKHPDMNRELDDSLCSSGQSVKSFSYFDVPYREYSKRLTFQGEQVGYIYLYISDDEIDEPKNGAFNYAILVTLTLLFFTFTASQIALRFVNRPLHYLSENVQSLSGRLNADNLGVMKEPLRLIGIKEIDSVTDVFSRLLNLIGVLAEEVRGRNDDLELRVRRRTSELQEAVTQKDQFVAFVAHELKGPAYTIQGYARFFALKVADGDYDDAVNLANTLGEQAHHLELQIEALRNLMEVSQTKASFEEIEFSALCRDIAHKEELRLRNETRSKVMRIPEVDVAQGMILWSDRDLVFLVMRNLISNALKYCSDPGSVSVYCCRTVDGVDVYVDNHGSLASDEDRLGVFELSYRSEDHKSIDGMGLGLNIAQAAARALGGRIDLLNRYPGKVTFRLKVPKEGCQNV